MGCSGCSTDNGLPAGCKNNGACGTYGCNKLDVFDWLSGIELPEGQKAFDVVEVRFKNSRKGFFRNPTGLEVLQGDVVAVEASPGHDIGVVSLTGELVRMQMKKKEVKDNYELKKIYRKARPEDIEKWQEARKLEAGTQVKARQIARSLNLQMKISDVEYQGDKSKATFFYTADDRVDFRELIRRYAEEFRVRVEMRQVGLRVEAGRVGGIGSCGRELCCSTWLTDFRAVSTSAARYQQLSLNPAKLAGQCGKLKCCLNYELDQYVEAIRDLPSNNVRLKLANGVAFHLKTDIFRRVMYYVYENQPGVAPIALQVETVRDIIERNRKGETVGAVQEYFAEEPQEKSVDFAEVVGQDSLTRFDRGKKPAKRNERSRGGERRPQNKPKPQGQQGAGKQEGQGPTTTPPAPRADQPRREQGSRQGGPNRSGGRRRPPGNSPRPENTGGPSK
jgi:cell fate regulator YaaT (PSP1 superfamily)